MCPGEREDLSREGGQCLKQGRTCWRGEKEGRRRSRERALIARAFELRGIMYHLWSGSGLCPVEVVGPVFALTHCRRGNGPREAVVTYLSVDTGE